MLPTFTFHLAPVFTDGGFYLGVVVGVVLAVRGDSLDARYSNGGKLGIAPNDNWTVTADAGALSGSLLVAGANNSPKSLIWPGRYNTPNGRAVSMLIRLKTGYTGTPSASRPTVPYLLAGGGRVGRIEIFHAVTTGQITAVVANEAGTAIVNTTLGVWSPTATTYYDLVLTFGGTNAANDLKFYVDAGLHGQATPTGSMSASWANTWFSEITLGGGVTTLNYNAASIDEIVIWDEVIDPTSVALVGGTGSLNGASRTALVDVSAFDGASYSDPGIANVRLSTGYTYAGLSKVGTAAIPTAANVRSGTATDATTGTYKGAGFNSDPGVGNVADGTAYEILGVALEGTLVAGSGDEPDPIIYKGTKPTPVLVGQVFLDGEGPDVVLKVTKQTPILKAKKFNN